MLNALGNLLLTAGVENCIAASSFYILAAWRFIYWIRFDLREHVEIVLDEFVFLVEEMSRAENSSLEIFLQLVDLR